MNYFITIMVAIIGSGVLNTLLNYYIRIREKEQDNKSDMQQALRLMMKDRLRFLCTHYILQEWIYEDELEDILAMHECYHDDLKGNGYLDELIKRVRKLDIRGVGVK